MIQSEDFLAAAKSCEPSGVCEQSRPAMEDAARTFRRDGEAEWERAQLMAMEDQNPQSYGY